MQRPNFSHIPLTPGIYIFTDARKSVIYVGKAKQLRRRLASYFREEHALTPKTKALMQQAAALQTISTATEKEALLLEASLIKKHRPHYNILLRDDKEYVLFRIDYSHPYPRLEITRQARYDKKKGHIKTFGPFTSSGDAKSTWKAIHRIFKLRRCNSRAFANRTRPCLYYHMGQCLAPCVLEVDSAQYAAMLKQVTLLLSGRSRELIQQMQKEMEQASAELWFEQAALLRDQIKAVQSTVERQAVVLPGGQDLDALGVAQTPDGLALGLLFVRQGALLGGRNFFWPGLNLEDAPELVLSFILQFYTQHEKIPPRIIAPWLPETPACPETPIGPEMAEAPDGKPLEAIESGAEETAALQALLAEMRQAPLRLSLPKGQDEERLTHLAATNAREYAKNTRNTDLSDSLGQRMGSARPIRRIEAVDISHTGGSSTRAGMVVFEDGKPRKEDWRAYALETKPRAEEAETHPSPAGQADYYANAAQEGFYGSDDYAALAAWAERRVKAGPPWPDLLLVDGGKGQLNAVCRALSSSYAQTVLAGPPWPKEDQLAAADIATMAADEWQEGCPGPEAPYSTELGAVAEDRSAPQDAETSFPFSCFVVAGIAKAREEDGKNPGRAIRRAGAEDRIFLPGRANPLALRSGSPELLYLQHVRDNVHDFVLGSHRRARSNRSMLSELARVPGVGPKFAELLWKHFGSIQAMAHATEDELRAVPGIGAKKAKALCAHLAVLVTPEQKKEPRKNAAKAFQA